MAETTKDSWQEYSKLVLSELERLHIGQESLKKEMNEKFTEINEKLGDLQHASNSISTLQQWKDNVTEVWSVTQMQQAKNQVYAQKNRWAIITGVVIAIQVIFS